MGMILPPYLNKNQKMLEKRLASARKKEEKAKARYETAQKYTQLCREALENACK